MSWRLTQLNQELCDQDRIILDLFSNKDVNYIGRDSEFKKLLNYNSSSKNLILMVDRNVWCSDIVKLFSQHLKYPPKYFLNFSKKKLSLLTIISPLNYF